MSEFILHNYPLSPFSEKVRCMLGHAGLDWRSVVTRETPPRPLLAALAGGYRKVPVAQIGADIFCDSHLIASEIAVLADRPLLALPACSEEVVDYVRRVDLQVFIACLLSSRTAALRRKVMASMSWLDIARFLLDRINIGRKSAVRGVNPRQVGSMVRAHLEDAERRLRDHDFLFGDTPCHADFSTYHSLWFMRVLAESPLPDPFPRTLAWLERMRAFGHGQARPMTAEEALAVAAAATPRAIAEAHRQDAQIGRQVSITPADYGREPSTGVLVGVLPERWIIARETAEAGLLHVHFPREGFRLQLI